MKTCILILALILSLPAFGCMNLKARLNLNGKELLIDQKVDHDQTYSFIKDAFVVNVTLPSGQKSGIHLIKIKIDKIDGTIMSTVSSPQLMLRDNQEAEITSQASGEPSEIYKFKLTVKSI